MDGAQPKHGVDIEIFQGGVQRRFGRSFGGSDGRRQALCLLSLDAAYFLRAGRFFDRQGRVHARVSVSFPKEFGCYIGAPLPLTA